jgi:hypothetical protein
LTLIDILHYNIEVERFRGGSMKRMKMTRHEDGGHSWFAVKRSMLEELGLKESISPYSYQSGETVYLEEDSDAAKFFDAYARKVLGFSPKENGWKNWQETKAQLFECKSSYKDKSPVRNYAPYNPNAKKTYNVGDKVKLYSKEYTVTYSQGSNVYVQSQEGKQYKLSKRQLNECENA